MKKTVTKILALLLCAVMLLGLCACGTEGGDATNGTVEHTAPAGKFILSCGAAFEVVYDDDGLVISVAGLNDPGIIIASGDEDYLGKTCADVAAELIQVCKDEKYMDVAKNIVFKQGENSQLPGTHFLEGIAEAIEKTAGEGGAKLTVVEEAALSEDGYLPLEIAKQLLLNYLGVEKFDDFRGGTELVEERYVVTVEFSGDFGSYTIDAVTGEIALADEEDNWDDPSSDETLEGEGFGQIEEDPFYEGEYDENLEEDPAPDVDLEFGD